MSKKNEMYKFDAIIIGAGIIGLSIGNELTKKFNNILVVDKEASFGKHISSRNSEVIHSGIYYNSDSLKAKLCTKGNKMIYDFCNQYSIKYNNCGKLIIASNETEIKQLNNLLLNGKKNGLLGLKIITKEQAQFQEPLIHCEAALSVPSTGIVDSHAVMKKLEYLIQSKNSSIIYNMKVGDINKVEDAYQLSFVNENYLAESKIVINAAGLYSNVVSSMLGISNYKIHYCKGDYYQTSLFRNQVNSLIYPLPNKHSLGIHLVLHLDGTISFGPNAYYADNIDYSITNHHKNEFLEHVNKFFKIDKKDLNEDFIGIRPKLQGPKESAKDFIIVNEIDKGYKNFINLIGIDSPGLTSSLAIGEYVKNIIV